MNSLGKIISINGMFQIAKNMIDKSVGDDAGTPQAQMKFKLLEKILGDESLTKILDQSSTAFPEGEIKVGESWEEKSLISIPMVDGLTIDSKNTVHAV